MDKQKLKKLMVQEGKFKVYSEQDLIKPISRLLEKKNYMIPIGVGSNSTSDQIISNSDQIISNNLIEKYFMDFLGIDEEESCVLKIMNPTTGELHKDYTRGFCNKTMNVPYRKVRSIFSENEDESFGHEIFQDSLQTDFVYAAGDLSGRYCTKNMRVTPVEFFAKYMNTKEEKNNSEFMFVRYATEFGSQDGFKNPIERYSWDHQYVKPSLENNVHYSKIKHFEDGEDSFVYVENRRLSIIKKRYFTNLTVNSCYYNNLLASLSYAHAMPRPTRSPLSTFLEEFYDGKFWGNSYELSFNSIKALQYNPTIFNDIKEYDEEDCLVFDSLDFSYNKNGDVSKSFAITPEGMYTVSRKNDGTISLSSPKDDLKSLNNVDDLVKSINVATRPAFDNYKNEGDKGPIKIKHFKHTWIESDKRKTPVNYLFNTVTKQSNIGTEDSFEIKQSSIYEVIERIYGSKIKFKDMAYQKPKNSSKLALDSENDEVQILADYLASEHKKIYADFLRNSYKVTLGKLKNAFQYVPRMLQGKKEDYENGDAISLGGGMYLKLIKYIPKAVMVSLPGNYDYRRATTKKGSEIFTVKKAQTTVMKIKATVAWLMETHYDVPKLNDDQVRDKKQLVDILREVDAYLGDSMGSNGLSGANTYFQSENLTSLIPFNYNERRGMYAINCSEFESVEVNDKSKNYESISRIINNHNGRVVRCEPFFEPTQYKIIAKDSAGNVAYSIVRPFIGLDINTDSGKSLISLTPSIPMHNFIFYVPKLKQNSGGQKVFSMHLYSSRNEELINCHTSFVDPLPTIQEDSQDISAVAHVEYQEVLDSQNSKAMEVIKNPFEFTLKDLLTGSLSKERHPYIKGNDQTITPYISEAWRNLFKSEPSKFFNDYKTPDIMFGKVGEKYEKLKRGDALKSYFKGTSWEVLRIDAWLGLRPTDKANLNLYNPDHWVNQRTLLDYEFLRYMLSIFLGGAYQLTTMVEAGMDTREINFETYDDRLYLDIIPPHQRGPYGVAILSPESKYEISGSLSYFAGCFSDSAGQPQSIGRKGFDCFAGLSFGWNDKSYKKSTLMALMGIRDGKISTYADFVVESFAPSLVDKTKKEKKTIRNRLHKFVMSEDYSKAVLMTASQTVIERLALGYDIGMDTMAPVENLSDEIRLVRNKLDFGNTSMINVFRDMFSLKLYQDATLNYSVYEIFRYLKSLVTEQRAGDSIENVTILYKNYLENLYEIKEYGKVDLLNRKVVFPEALKTQADIARYNRDLIKDQAEMARFQKGSSQYKIMEYSDSRYTIRMAKSPLELQLEGDTLGHCVGSYVNSMSSGTNIIFFLRDKKHSDKSNVTVEFVPYVGSLSNLSISSGCSSINFNGDDLEFVMRGYINQVQGMSRRPVNREEALFLNEWRSFVQSQMRKKISFVPSFNKKKKVKIKHEFTFGLSIQKQIDDQLNERSKEAIG